MQACILPKSSINHPPLDLGNGSFRALVNHLLILKYLSGFKRNMQCIYATTKFKRQILLRSETTMDSKLQNFTIFLFHNHDQNNDAEIDES